MSRDGQPRVGIFGIGLAAYWPQFASFAQEPDRRLWFSAAAGGAVPMLETLSHLGRYVRELRGVINGTSNRVLDSMAAGGSPRTRISRNGGAGIGT